MKIIYKYFPGPSVSIDYGDGFDGVNDANDDIDINDDEPPARDENLTNRPGSAYCNCISIILYLVCIGPQTKHGRIAIKQ